MNDMTTPLVPGAIPARRHVPELHLPLPSGRSHRSTYTRLMRRETHSPRAVVAIGLASTVIAGCLYCGTELVLELLDRPALLAAPTDVVRYVSQINRIAPAILLTAGVLLALAGIVLVLVAVLPGRRARHGSVSARTAVVVDDDVIAASLERAVATAARVAPGNVAVTVSRRNASVLLTPESGVIPNRFTAAKAIADALAYDALRPSIEPTVVVNPTGRVGA